MIRITVQMIPVTREFPGFFLPHRGQKSASIATTLLHLGHLGMVLFIGLLGFLRDEFVGMGVLEMYLWIRFGNFDGWLQR